MLDLGLKRSVAPSGAVTPRSRDTGTSLSLTTVLPSLGEYLFKPGFLLPLGSENTLDVDRVSP